MNARRKSLPQRKLLVLANKGQGRAPNQRYRFEQWAPRLERDHAIRLDLLPFESDRLSEILYEPGKTFEKSYLALWDLWRRQTSLSLSKSYDAVLIVREAALLGPPIYERLLARTGKPIIYDFDDAIWSRQQERLNRWFALLRSVRKTSAICRSATAVTVGNSYLAEYARQYNLSVHIVPSSIELDDYPLIDEPDDQENFIVCWTGSTSTLVHFERARPALEELATILPLVVKVICGKPPKPIAGAQNHFVPWSAQQEAEEVGACHVGIMPLPDDEISRGKCSMKALQFMATGRPVVVSPVGTNLQVVEHNQNGLLAGSTDEFVSSLLHLARSPLDRRRLGANGRRTVEQRYSAEVVSKAFAAVIMSALS